MEKNKKLLKIFSVILSVLIIANILPMQVFAEEVTAVTEEITAIGDTTETEIIETERVILSEETAKREEYVKHFRMSDGTYQAVQYETPVHFEKNNEWVEYDNSLEEAEASDEENEGKIFKNKDYINKLADFSVRFSKKTNGHKFVRYEKDGYELSWYYEDAKKKYAEVIEVEDDGDETTLEKNSSQVVYKGVFKDTDLQYIVNTEGVKENIILNSSKAPTEYVAQYKVNGLMPVEIDSKTIELQDDNGEAIYIISAPYMIDNNGEISNNLSLELSDVKNNKFTVTLTLDSSWLQEENRAYPVIADPAIVTSQYWGEATSSSSAFVSSRHDEKCYGKGTSGYEGSLYVGYETVVSNLADEYGLPRQKVRGYFQCPQLPELSIADKVVDAKVTFCCQLSSVNTILLYGVTEAWESNSITWENQPAWEDNICDYINISSDIPNLQYPWSNPSSWLSWEITDLVQKWYADPSTNHGFVLKAAQEEVGYKTWLYSSDYNGRYYARPYITVTYRNMSGYEDYYNYTSLSAGRGGTASVNNYNGNFIYTQPLTLDTGCNNMPVNISLTYNNNFDMYNSADSNDKPLYSFIGQRMQTNYHIYIKENDNEDVVDNFKYYLNDSDGTKHWFYFENIDATTGKDEDNLGYTLDVINVGSDTACTNAKYRITDKSKNKMYFDADGHLIQITNANGISSYVTYQTVENTKRIDYITDGAGRNYIFSYYVAYPYIIESITDPVGRKTSFGYENWFLKDITFPDSKTIYLDYVNFDTDITDMLVYILGSDGVKTCVDYDFTPQRRAISFFISATDSDGYEKYDFEYRLKETVITDWQGRIFTYQFNDWGQNTAVVSNENGNAQFFKYNNSSDAAANAKNTSRNRLLSSSKVINSVSNYVVNSGFQRGFESYWTWDVNTDCPTEYSVVTDIGCLTNNALKISKGSYSTYDSRSAQTFLNLESGWYTVSGYVNTFGETLGGDGLDFGCEVWSVENNGDADYRVFSEKITKTNGWERFEIVVFIPEGKEFRIVFGFDAADYGTVYLDDLQLEKGDQGASSYNIIENAGFRVDVSQWYSENNLIKFELLGPTSDENVACIPGDITDEFRRAFQDLNVSGKAGDVYSFGSWLCGESVPTDRERTGNLYPCFEIKLHYYDTSGVWKDAIVVKANPDCKDEWQFVSSEAIIPVDYSKLSFEICYNRNANIFWFSMPFCYREQFGQSYTYDNEGNVVSAKDLADANSSFAYQGNNLVNAINPSGSAFLYRYDDVNNNLLCADSTNGVRYVFDYDAYGNATSATVSEMKFATQLEYNVEYVIRNKHSANTLDMGGLNELVHNYGYSYGYENKNQYWTIEYAGEDGVYYLKANDRYLYVDGSSGEDGAYFKTSETNTGEDKFKFKIDGNGNGTWSIKSKTSNYVKCVDGMPGDTNDCSNATPITQQTYDKDNAGQQWYFYIKDSGNGKKVISTSAEYIRNGNYLYTQTDQLGNVTKYNYDQLAGRLYSVTDAKGNMTKYTYNNDTNQLASVISGGMTNYYHYENDRLTYINSNNSVGYRFTYDNFGRVVKNEVGNGTDHRTLSTMFYDKQLLVGQAYGNGDYINYSYDNLDRLTEIKYNDNESKKKTYVYGTDGNVSSVLDTSSNTRTKYVYDLSGRLVKTKEYSGADLKSNLFLSSVDYIYQDKTNYLNGMTHTSSLGVNSVWFNYGNIANGEMPDQVYSVWWNYVTNMDRTYDGLGRLSSTVINPNVNNKLTTNYYYKDVSDTQTTTQLQSMVTPAGTFTYTYDSLGNITSINDGTYTLSYEYDSLNQLVRENDQRTGKTYTYTYLNGNITSKTEYAYTTGELGAVVNTITYGYDDPVWKDLLTSYNGMNITYDNIGNMTSFNGRTFNWTGRQLDGFSDGTSSAVYQYNMDGLRTKKVYDVDFTLTILGSTIDIDSTKTNEYFYNGSILAGEKITIVDNKTNSTTGHTITFLYDENGDYFGFTHNGTYYYYIKNAQNDVVAIADSAGVIKVRYYYDSWGKIINTEDISGFDLATLNPIRYRSYYYDNESGYYYLQSRYYNPEIGRFINADCLVSGVGGSVLGYNMFAYCFNNPVNMDDSNGNRASLINKFIGFVTAVLAVVKSKTKIANVVTKTHTTTEIEKIDLGVGFGEVGFSSNTIISENEEPAFLCAYSDVGLEESRHGVSVNEDGVLGAGFGFSDEGNVFVNAQLASVLHAEVSLGIDGVGGSIGVDVGKTSYDFEIKIGWGTLALIPLIPLFNSGEESNSPAYAY